MIGLLKKDLFILWQAYRKNLALILILYTGFAVASGASFWVVMFTWVFGFYVIGGLSIDNYAKWDLYACGLPVSKNQIVGSKFILILLSLISSFVLSVLICILLTLVQHQPFGEMLLSCFYTSCICLAYFGIMLALSYQFGPEKARGSMILVLLAFFALVMLAAKLGLFDGLENTAVTQWLQSSIAPVIIGMGLLIVCGGIYLICWAAATKIYSKKEF